MHWPVLTLMVLLAGCLSMPAEDGWAWQDDPCMGIGYRADGVHPGAWENATSAGSGFGAPYMDAGIPVGPGVARFLGSDANITAVRWRVDGGPVEEAGSSWRNGRLASPEYLEVRFWGAPVLDGTLDPMRSPEEAAAVVRAFLDQVRGERQDNAGLAADAAPALLVPSGGDGPVSPGEEVAPAPEPERPVPLPDGPWTASSHLAAHLDAAELRTEPSFHTLVDGPWRWVLDVPHASNATYPEEASWRVVVDARDHVYVQHNSKQELNETTLTERLAVFLPQHGVVGADLATWDLHLDGWPSDVCPPRPDPRTAVSV